MDLYRQCLHEHALDNATVLMQNKTVGSHETIESFIVGSNRNRTIRLSHNVTRAFVDVYATDKQMESLFRGGGKVLQEFVRTTCGFGTCLGSINVASLLMLNSLCDEEPLRRQQQRAIDVFRLLRLIGVLSQHSCNFIVAHLILMEFYSESGYYKSVSNPKRTHEFENVIDMHCERVPPYRLSLCLPPISASESCSSHLLVNNSLDIDLRIVLQNRGSLDYVGWQYERTAIVRFLHMERWTIYSLKYNLQISTPYPLSCILLYFECDAIEDFLEATIEWSNGRLSQRFSLNEIQMGSGMQNWFEINLCHHTAKELLFSDSLTVRERRAISVSNLCIENCPKQVVCHVYGTSLNFDCKMNGTAYGYLFT